MRLKTVSIAILIAAVILTVSFWTRTEQDPVFQQALNESGGDKVAAIKLMGYSTCDEGGNLVYVSLNRTIPRNRRRPLRLNNGVLRELSEFESIRTLIIGVVNDIDDRGMGHIAKLSNLELLNLRLVAISDRGLKKLTNLNKLQVLMVDATNLSDDAIEEFQAALPRCDLRIFKPT